MRSKRPVVIAMKRELIGEEPLDTAQRLEPITNADPQDARHAALGENSHAFERDVERRLSDRRRKRRADALLDRVCDRSEKMQRQVHPVGTHPRRFRVRLDCGAQSRGDAAHLLPRGFININRDE